MSRATAQAEEKLWQEFVKLGVLITPGEHMRPTPAVLLAHGCTALCPKGLRPAQTLQLLTHSHDPAAGKDCHAPEPGYFRICYAAAPVEALLIGIARMRSHIESKLA